MNNIIWGVALLEAVVILLLAKLWISAEQQIEAMWLYIENLKSGVVRED